MTKYDRQQLANEASRLVAKVLADLNKQNNTAMVVWPEKIVILDNGETSTYSFDLCYQASQQEEV